MATRFAKPQNLWSHADLLLGKTFALNAAVTEDQSNPGSGAYDLTVPHPTGINVIVKVKFVGFVGAPLRPAGALRRIGPIGGT